MDDEEAATAIVRERNTATLWARGVASLMNELYGLNLTDEKQGQLVDMALVRVTNPDGGVIQ